MDYEPPCDASALMGSQRGLAPGLAPRLLGFWAFQRQVTSSERSGLREGATEPAATGHHASPVGKPDYWVALLVISCTGRIASGLNRKPGDTGLHGPQGHGPRSTGLQRAWPAFEKAPTNQPNVTSALQLRVMEAKKRCASSGDGPWRIPNWEAPGFPSHSSSRMVRNSGSQCAHLQCCCEVRRKPKTTMVPCRNAFADHWRWRGYFFPCATSTGPLVVARCAFDPCGMQRAGCCAPEPGTEGAG